MNQEQNNLNQNNFNIQDNNIIHNNQQPMSINENGMNNNPNLNNKPTKKMNLGLIIGIVFAVAVVSLVLVFVILGNKEDKNQGSSSNKENNTNNQEEQIDTDKTEIDDDWGVIDDFSVQNEKLEVSTVYFRWPTATGRSAATGMGATQSDGTFVLVDGYSNGISPKDVALKDFFPKYFGQTLNAFSRNYGSNYKNGELKVGSCEFSKINGYEVCKYTGHHTFEFNGKNYDYQFVAYVTTLKSNGGYVYWLVQDETDDQSATKQMEENAYKIISSIKES